MFSALLFGFALLALMLMGLVGPPGLVGAAAQRSLRWR